METLVESPTIHRLQQQIASGDSDAPESFWRDVTARGTPLVESLAGDDQHSLVTFLWRPERDVDNVVITPAPAVFGWAAANNQMTRLAGSDLWHRTYRVRNDLRATYYFSPDDPFADTSKMDLDERTAYFEERARAALQDPLNPLTFKLNPDMPPESVVELPGAPPQPWAKRQPEVPRGRVEPSRFDSKMFGNARAIWIYLPPGYDPQAVPYPLLLLFDGPMYLGMRIHVTLDNMIAAGVIPETVCVMVEQVDRNVELTCNDEFAEWLTLELLPWVRARYPVTSDPARAVIAGSSYGGLAAAFIGLRHSDIFGNVLCQSGSFWWGPGYETLSDFENEAIEQEWLIHQFETAGTRPLRFYLDIGLLEDGWLPHGGPNAVASVRNMRDVAQAQGHAVHYAEFYGGHQCICWRGTIADGLIALLGQK